MMRLVLLTTSLALAAAAPSYIAVPADQIAFLDLSSLRVRRPRQTLTPPPPPPAQIQLPQALYNEQYQEIPILPQYTQQNVPVVNYAPPQVPQDQVLAQVQQKEATESESLGAAEQYNERPPDFGEYVDFGAHTGDNGAFGWYADYPINNNNDHSY